MGALHQPTDPVVATALAAAAVEARVPIDLVLGVAWVESRFKPDALSHVGARGLMQLMPQTAIALGVTDPTNPVQNALGGARFLHQLYVRFGGAPELIDQPNRAWELALGAYNWGPARVQAQPDPLRWPQQVRTYVTRVWGAAGWPLPFEVVERNFRVAQSRSRRGC